MTTGFFSDVTRAQGGRPAVGPRSRRTGELMPVLTSGGRRQLTAKADRLRALRLPELCDALADRRRDATVEADYERAFAELHQLEDLLSIAESVDAWPDDPEVVELGDLITLEIGDDIERYVIVHPAEAALDDLRVSADAPLAQALLGRHVGELVEIRGPRATYSVRILGASRLRESTAAG